MSVWHYGMHAPLVLPILTRPLWHSEMWGYLLCMLVQELDVVIPWWRNYEQKFPSGKVTAVLSSLLVMTCSQVAIVTLLMNRAHSTPLAGDICFVDSTASCDADNHAITFMLTPTAAGAVPLGVLITDSASKSSYTAAFNQLKTKPASIILQWHWLACNTPDRWFGCRAQCVAFCLAWWRPQIVPLPSTTGSMALIVVFITQHFKGGSANIDDGISP